MASATTKNLHVPLSAPMYKALRIVAEREHRPATQVARTAIADYLRAQRKRAAEDELRAYVVAEAGGPEDLDPALEAASIDHLVPRKRRGR